jgi:outer membrane protein assembly factor BamB
MPVAQKVFISHTHADNERCAFLLAFLDAWGIAYWFDIEQLSPGQELSGRIQEALAQSDAFVRVCTLEAQRSYWMSKELSAYRSLAGGNRKIIFLVLDRDYILDPLEKGDLLINVTTEGAPSWIARLRAALGVRAAARRLSRRTAVGLGAAATLSVAGLGAGILVAVERSLEQGTHLPRPTSYLPTPTPVEGARRVKWTYAYEAGFQPVDLTLSGGTLYLNTDLGILALSATDGRQLWIGSQVVGLGAPQVVGTTVYTYDSNGDLDGTHLADGTPAWHVALGSFVTVSMVATTVGIYAWANGKLYALGLDGSKRWSVPLGPQDAADGSGCAAANGVVYVNAPDGFLYALSTADGSLRWRQPMPGTFVPTIAGSTLYVASNGSLGDDRLYALDALTGITRWSADLGDGAGGQAAIAGNLALVGGITRGLLAVDLTSHKVLWAGVSSQNSPDPGVSCLPAVAAGTAYVTTHDGYLVAFDLHHRGAALWRFAVGGTLLATSPAVSGGLVYVSGGDQLRGVYALDTSPTP